MVPALPEDTSNLGASPREDARLFPTDEELGQRTLWIAFLISLGWTVLGLAGALPLYMVSTPCVADSSPKVTYGGRTSTLTDLSLFRLLKMIDDRTVTTGDNPSTLMKRAIIDGVNESPKARTRLIILTVLLILLGILPVLFKLYREFNTVLAYRIRWLDVQCAGVEMGWLSLSKTPGFTGWSEGRMKEFLLKNGLTSGLDRSRSPRGGRMIESQADIAYDAEESGESEIDIHGFFTITYVLQLRSPFVWS